MNNIRSCDVTSIRAEYLDCCLPDYFQGSDAEEVLAVPVTRNMTGTELYEATKQEFHTQSGFFDDVAGSGSMAEEAIHALFAAVLIEVPDNIADMAKDLELDTTVYMYIALYAESDLEENDDE